VPIPCSRNAHDQNVLDRRAQWDQPRVPSLWSEVQASSDGTLDVRSGKPIRPPGSSAFLNCLWAL
jgi:hypothetical protein